MWCFGQFYYDIQDFEDFGEAGGDRISCCEVTSHGLVVDGVFACEMVDQPIAYLGFRNLAVSCIEKFSGPERFKFLEGFVRDVQITRDKSFWLSCDIEDCDGEFGSIAAFFLRHAKGNVFYAPKHEELNLCKRINAMDYLFKVAIVAMVIRITYRFYWPRFGAKSLAMGGV